MASFVLNKYREAIAAEGGGDCAFVFPYAYGPKLLRAQVAAAVLGHMLSEPLGVVGGDVWVIYGEKYEIREDWFCERTPAESVESFSRRSMETALNRIAKALQRYGNDTLLDLVVKDAITGEMLPRAN